MAGNECRMKWSGAWMKAPPMIIIIIVMTIAEIIRVIIVKVMAIVS